MPITTKSYRRFLPDPDDRPRTGSRREPDQVIQDTSRDLVYKNLDPSSIIPVQAQGTSGKGPQTGPQQDDEATNVTLHRLWREATVWVAGCVEMREDDVTAAQGGCRPKDPKETSTEIDLTRDLVETLLQNPYPASAKNKDDGDPDADHAGLVGACTEDLLVTGQMVMKPSYRRSGEIFRLAPFDSTRVTSNPKWEPGSKLGRWIIDQGTDQEEEVGYNELIVVRLRPRTYADTGLAPMTSIHRFLLAELDTFRMMHYHNKTNQPSGILKIPTPNNRTITKIINQWRGRVQGKGGIVIANLPAETDFLKIGNDTAPAVMDWIDLLLRGIGFGFRIPSLRMNWTRTMLDRTEEGQSEIYDEGKFNLLRLWARVITRRILPSFEYGGALEWYYTELDALSDQAESVEVINAKSGGDVHVFPIATLWEQAGLGELPWTEEQLARDPDLYALVYEPRVTVGNEIYVPASHWSKHIAQALAQQQQGQGSGQSEQPTPSDDQQPQLFQPQPRVTELPSRFGETQAQAWLAGEHRSQLRLVRRDASTPPSALERRDASPFDEIYAEEEAKLRSVSNGDRSR